MLTTEFSHKETITVHPDNIEQSLTITIRPILKAGAGIIRLIADTARDPHIFHLALSSGTLLTVADKTLIRNISPGQIDCMASDNRTLAIGLRNQMIAAYEHRPGKDCEDQNRPIYHMQMPKAVRELIPMEDGSYLAVLQDYQAIRFNQGGVLDIRDEQFEKSPQASERRITLPADMLRGFHVSDNVFSICIRRSRIPTMTCGHEYIVCLTSSETRYALSWEDNVLLIADKMTSDILSVTHGLEYPIACISHMQQDTFAIGTAGGTLYKVTIHP